MKKALKLLLVSALVATLFSSVALAEVNIGAWGRALFVPAVSNHKGEVVTRETASWWENSRYGTTINASSDNVGIAYDLYFDGGAPSGGDQQKIWVKPMDIVTLEFGATAFFDGLRGNSGFGSWNWWRPGIIKDEDVTFDRLNVGRNGKGGSDSRGAGANQGVEAGWSARVETGGITAYAGLDIYEDDHVTTEAVEADADAGTAAVAEKRTVMTTAMTLQRGQYGAGYAIAGVGLVRAQYIGAYYVDGDDVKEYGIINAAVKIDQIMPALYVDLGAFIPTDTDQADPKKNGAFSGVTNQTTEIAAYIKYAMAPMTIHFQTRLLLDAADAEGETGMGMQIGVGFDMDLGNGLGLTTDVRYANANGGAGADTKGKALDMAYSALAGVEKGFSNGKLGVAVQIASGTGFAGGDIQAENGNEDMMWAIPVKAEYWF